MAMWKQNHTVIVLNNTARRTGKYILIFVICAVFLFVWKCSQGRRKVSAFMGSCFVNVVQGQIETGVNRPTESLSPCSGHVSPGARLFILSGNSDGIYLLATWIPKPTLSLHSLAPASQTSMGELRYILDKGDTCSIPKYQVVPWYLAYSAGLGPSSNLSPASTIQYHG